MQFEARYAFDVSLDAEGRATAIELLTATNRTTAPIDELNLFVLPHWDAVGFREFELGWIQVDGHALSTTWTEEGANLLVRLPGALEPGASVTISLSFSLEPGRDANSAMAAMLSQSDELIQFVLWYPILSDGHGARLNGDGNSATPVSHVDFVIRSTAPVAFAVPGTVTRRSAREVRGTLDDARDFAFAIGRRLRSWSARSSSGISVTVYAPPEREGRATLDIARAAVDGFGNLLRTPYPAARLVVVGGRMDMESSGIVFLDETSLGDGYTVRHEVAHQWFHWLVGSDQLREPWLDEAFATYLGRGLKPREDSGFCSALPVNSPVERFAAADPKAIRLVCGSYFQTVYNKGSWMLDDVRKAMGRAAFLASLREYLASHRFQVATADDIVAIWVAHSRAVTPELLGRWLALDEISFVPGVLPAARRDGR